MSGHTQGPWRVSERNEGVIYAEGEPFAVAYINDEEGAVQDRRANARLIAAAPDMLEILEQCAKRGWMWDNDPSLYNATMKVIRKAKGQA